MKDTNPDHYKVDNADFIKFMNDPQIKGFGDWMFANGFNMGELSVNRCIKEIEGYIADADKAISEDEEYIRGWKSALLVALEVITKIGT